MSWSEVTWLLLRLQFVKQQHAASDCLVHPFVAWQGTRAASGRSGCCDLGSISCSERVAEVLSLICPSTNMAARMGLGFGWIHDDIR